MAKRKDPMTVFMIEFCGDCRVNETTRPFNDIQIYYLNRRTQRVYRTWFEGEYLISANHRSMVACERSYHASAKRMGRFFPNGVSTLLTVLGEL